MGEHQGLGEQLVLGGAQGVVAHRQARGEVDDQGDRLAATVDQALQGRAEQVDAGRRGAVHRGQAEVEKHLRSGPRLAARPAEHAEPGQRIPGQHLGVAGVQQGVAEGLVEALRGDRTRHHFAGLQVADVPGEDELTLEGQEAQEVAQPAWLFEQCSPWHR